MVPPPQPRTLPLFDPSSHPQSWNELMVAGEVAVLYSGEPIPSPSSPNDTSISSPYCVVFPSLTAAENSSAQTRREIALMGSRVITTGLVLLFIDAGILLNLAHRRRREQKS